MGNAEYPAHELKDLFLRFVYSIKRWLQREWKLTVRVLLAIAEPTCGRALTAHSPQPSPSSSPVWEESLGPGPVPWEMRTWPLSAVF